MKLKRFLGQTDKIETSGAIIVVDILRAATLEAYLLAQGASFILPVETVAEAFALKEQHPEYMLAGEEHGYPIKGFDFGNSPSQIKNIDFSGKVIVHRTSNGTRQLLLAHADELLLGSLVTISATYKYLKHQNVSLVSLIGAEDEDTIFFDGFDDYVRGEILNKEYLSQKLLAHAKGSYFWDEGKPEFPKEDVYLAAEIDVFNFACVVKKEGDRLVTRKV